MNEANGLLNPGKERVKVNQSDLPQEKTTAGREAMLKIEKTEAEIKTRIKKDVVDERKITITFKKDNSIIISATEDCLVTAGEMNKAQRVLTRWYRVARRDYQVKQNRLTQKKE